MAFYPKVFATIYNPILASGELAGMRRMRHELLAEAHGSVLEIGAGTGLNLRHYPDAVKELTLTEPDAAMYAKLGKTTAGNPLQPRLVQAPAEHLPFEDDSFDTVVSTMVLCTVADPAASLAEINRVLRPGGKLLLIEHVQADEGRRLRKAQNSLHRPWKAFGCGCNCNLDTDRLLAAAGFGTGGLQRGKWKLMPPLIRPLILGAVTAD
ncbi:MAG TPA: class I SAM-dependent methyltransferase [Sporichthyaceae bacterium]|nr:class I SAM-dependent methyltransferase [Sporichthyaceae bacterium]